MENVKAVYSREILSPAAEAQGLSADEAQAILLAAPAGWDRSLVSYIRQKGVTGGLDEFRKAFPGIFNSGNDNTDSFLIRVAAIAEGGLAV